MTSRSVNDPIVEPAGNNGSARFLLHGAAATPLEYDAPAHLEPGSIECAALAVRFDERIPKSKQVAAADAVRAWLRQEAVKSNLQAPALRIERQSKSRWLVALEVDGSTPAFVDEVSLGGAKARAATLAEIRKVAPNLDADDIEARLKMAALEPWTEKKNAADGTQGTAVTWPEIEPWSEPVDGAALLDAVRERITKHSALPSEAAADVVVLWAVHTWLADAASTSPRLILASATPRAGKSTTLSVLAALVRRPLISASCTAAAMFRLIDRDRPSVLMDEVDAVFGRDGRQSEPGSRAEEVRAIANTGHSCNGAVTRVEGPNLEVRSFRCYSPMLLSGIGTLPSTLVDRSFVVRMRRRLPSERVERVDLRRINEQCEALRRQLARWSADHAADIAEAEPKTPAALNDRAADNARILLAIADAAGAGWPARARAAVVELAGGDDDEGELGVLLLRHLKGIFDSRGRDRLPTADVLAELNTLEGEPWAAMQRGRGLNARGLRRLLDPFGIKSGNIRFGSDEQAKGYLAADLRQAWDRYLAVPSNSKPVSRPNVPSETASGSQGGSIRPTPDAGTDSIRPNVSAGTDATGLQPKQDQAWDGGTAKGAQLRGTDAAAENCREPREDEDTRPTETALLHQLAADPDAEVEL